MKIYTSRPTQRRARLAWDYFKARHGCPMELFCGRNADGIWHWNAMYLDGCGMWTESIGTACGVQSISCQLLDRYKGKHR